MKRIPHPQKTRTLLAASAIGLLTLTGCQTFEGLKNDFQSINFPSFSSFSANKTQKQEQVGACPKIEIVEDLRETHNFMDPSGPTPDKRVSSAEFAAVSVDCRVNNDSAQLDMTLLIKSNLGPRAREELGPKPGITHPYFLAVTTGDGDILSKEIFAASATYGPNQTDLILDERLRQTIPLQNSGEAGEYTIMIGFQLEKDQLAYNRSIVDEQRPAVDVKIKKIAVAAPQRETTSQ